MQLWHLEECTGVLWARECQQYALAAASEPKASALSPLHTALRTSSVLDAQVTAESNLARMESVIFNRKLWDTVFTVVCLKVGPR